MKVQIVGKISGKIINQAQGQFKVAADFLKILGYEPWNPMEHINPNIDYEEQMQICLNNIQNVDAIVLLDDFGQSTGAIRELKQALMLNKKLIALSWLEHNRLYITNNE